MMAENSFIAVFIKMFFLLTPFFALSMFLAVTDELSDAERHRLAVRTTLAVMTICLIIYWFGQYLFQVLGITVNAFRVGAGIILLLTAIGLVTGANRTSQIADKSDDVSVVPLAIPYIVGPGTIGALLVMGIGCTLQERLVSTAGIATAVLVTGAFLYASNFLEKILKAKGMQILTKITGLMLAALAAQIIFEGARNLLHS